MLEVERPLGNGPMPAPAWQRFPRSPWLDLCPLVICVVSKLHGMWSSTSVSPSPDESKRLLRLVVVMVGSKEC